VQQITVSEISFSPFRVPFLKPFTFANTVVRERSGFYLTLKTAEGLKAVSEMAPLEGISPETIRRAKHDLKDSCAYLKQFKFAADKQALIEQLRHDPHMLNLCGSVRFAVESAIFMMAASANKQGLIEFLGGIPKDVHSAILLQGNHQEVLSDVKYFLQAGAKVFKLKVGDRNIALDVKKVNDIRMILEHEAYLRLDANRQWTFKEACIFADLVGNQRIDFIEEPINDPTQFDAFYQKTRMRVALDETLQVIKCGINAPGRCSPPIAQGEGIIAYILKPMVLGFMPVLDWMEEAKVLKRKAIISSLFESPVALKIIAQMACVSGQIAGLGTERWFKNSKPFVGEDGIIKKDLIL